LRVVRLDNLFKKIRSLTENYRGGDVSEDGEEEDREKENGRRH
jgi:hypothetical protein